MHFVFFVISLFSIYNSPQNAEEGHIDHKYTVYFFLLDDCKICREYGPELESYHTSYGSDKIQFIGVFPNFSSKGENIEKFKKKYNITFELKTDYFKKLSNKLDANVLPEVFVYDHNKNQVIYRGRIDDRYVSIAQRRRIIKHYDLKEVLNNITEDKEIKFYKTEAIGCLINYNDNL